MKKYRITYTTDVAHCEGRACPIRDKCMRYPREDVYPIMPSTAYDDIIDEIENEIKCGGFNKEYLKQWTK